MKTGPAETLRRTGGDSPGPSRSMDLLARLHLLADLVFGVPPVADPHACGRLLWRDGTGSIRVLEVTGECVIGRAAGCDVQLDCSRVSGRHGRIWVDRVGCCWLEDLGSRNGTKVNGRVLPGPRPLAGGDIIEVGGVTLGVDIGAPRSVRPPVDDSR